MGLSDKGFPGNLLVFRPLIEFRLATAAPTMNSSCRLFFLLSFLYLSSSHFVFGQLILPDASPPGIQDSFPQSIVIGISIFTLFSVALLLLVYAKFCHASAGELFVRNHDHFHSNGLITPQQPRFSGVDKTVIESLPFFRFSALKGSREGLECAVCLSRFEDPEILRLLPKCKHAFHIGCVDRWLESHSSCPLCRFKVEAGDLTLFKYSTSSRFLFRDPSVRKEDLDLELFVERKPSGLHHPGSSRFNIGSSFRKIEKGKKENKEVLLLANTDDDGRLHHKFKHKIIISDVVFKNRWSDVNSSDLMSLNSEMLNMVSSNRFSYLDSNNDRWISAGGDGMGSIPVATEIVNIKDDMEKKRLLENMKVSQINPGISVSGFPSTSDTNSNMSSAASKDLIPSGNKRSISEITNLPRFKHSGGRINVGIVDGPSNSNGGNTKDEKVRRLWLPMARRTVQWFAGKEKRPPQALINARPALGV